MKTPRLQGMLRAEKRRPYDQNVFFVVVGVFTILAATSVWVRAFEVGAPVVIENPEMIHALFACIIVAGLFTIYSGIGGYRRSRKIWEGG